MSVGALRCHRESVLRKMNALTGSIGPSHSTTYNNVPGMLAPERSSLLARARSSMLCFVNVSYCFCSEHRRATSWRVFLERV